MAFDLGPGWTPDNRMALTAILARYGQGGPEFNPVRPPVAALDWDDTVIDHDVGDALLFYQIDYLAFDFDAPGFWELIPDELRDAWRAAVRPLLHLPLDEARLHPAYPTYRYLGYRLYRTMLVAPRDIGYPWFTRILLGLTVPQVYALTEATLERDLSLPLGEAIIPSLDGREPVRVRSGLRYRPAMTTLIQALLACGFQVWVVSATNRWAVEVMASRLGIPAGRVVGMTTAVHDGRITIDLVPPAPYFAGKAGALRELLEPGARVVLAAGDSPSDEELLRLAEAGRLLTTPRNADLLARAEAEQARGEPWLIQRSFGEWQWER
jgi:phosphoserine phosphatase